MSDTGNGMYLIWNFFSGQEFSGYVQQIAFGIDRVKERRWPYSSFTLQ